jgi:hypothetical protein
MLKGVDGMASIDDVTEQIQGLLSAARPSKTARKAVSKPKSVRRKAKPAKAAKTARKAGARRKRPAAASRTRRKTRPGQRKNRTRRRLTRAR